MTKICFISPFIYPLFNPHVQEATGGAEYQIYLLSKELVNKNFNISIIVGDYGQKNQEIINDIKLLKFSPKQATTCVDYLKAIFSFIFSLVTANSTIYIQRGASAESFLTYIYCSIFRKKFIFMTAHEQDCNGDFITQHKILGQLYKIALTHANLVITQNICHQQLLKNIFLINSKVLPNSIEIKKYNGKRNFILWAARLDKWKNPETFLNIAKLIPDQKFIMIAPYTKNIKYCKSIESEAKTIPNLKLIPGVSQKRIFQYLSQSIVFINTSLSEGFPNTFLEACVTKTPILSLNVNPDNFITKSKSGLFANGNEKRLLNQLKKILSSYKQSLDMGKNGFLYISQYHNLKTNTSLLVNYLKNI